MTRDVRGDPTYRHRRFSFEIIDTGVRLFPTLVFLSLSLPALPQPAPANDASRTDITRLLSEYATAEYFWQQTDIARKLIATGDRQIIAAIQPYLETNDRSRRCNAAFVLAGLDDERGAVILISELQDTVPGTRAVGSVDFVGNPSAEALAMRQMVQDRYFAALLLGELRERSAVPALVAVTHDDSINYRAAESLGEIGDASAIPALREMAVAFAEEGALARVSAGYGLAALGAREGFDILRDVALLDPQWVRRRYAVELLGKTADQRAVAIVLQALKDTHPNVRVSAARSLAKIGDPETIPALRAVVGDSEVPPENAPTTVGLEAHKAIVAIESKPR